MTHDANDTGLGIPPIARARKISEILDPASHASLRHETTQLPLFSGPSPSRRRGQPEGGELTGGVAVCRRCGKAQDRYAGTSSKLCRSCHVEGKRLAAAEQNASCCEGELYRAVRDRADVATVQAAQQRLHKADARLVQLKARRAT